MAKKGGKKKGGGKKAKKGGGGGGDDQMTLKEAILAFQIQIKEKQLEELRTEIQGLNERNQRFRDRNTRLKDEQFIHIKTLLRQAKEQEQELEQREIYNSEHVENALREKWEASRREDASVEELMKSIAEVEKTYQVTNGQVEYWTAYRDVGSHEHKTQIKLLESELEDMKQNFEDMCAHLKRQLDAAKQEVTAHTDSCMAEQKLLASEKAMQHLDQASVQEVLENEWLRKEAQVHRQDELVLRHLLEELERENLEIIGELLDCHQEDLKISRNFYTDRFEEEVLDHATMIDMDLKKMSIYQRGYRSPGSQSPPPGTERAGSAMQQAVERKVFGISLADDDDDDVTYDVGDDEERALESTLIAHQDEDINVYEDKEFLHLGPLEVKLLCVTGTSKPIYDLDANEEIVDGSRADLTVTRPRWPVQTPMLRAAIERSHSSRVDEHHDGGKAPEAVECA